MDSHDLAAWSALTCLLLGIAVLQFEFARRALATLGERVLQSVTAEPEVDSDALDLYNALRRQRLLTHVARLRRILADDSHQSAVRQIGNRLAYSQLLAEVAELGELARVPLALPDPEVSWTPVASATGRAGAGSQYAPRVEVLDFGRRR